MAEYNSFNPEDLIICGGNENNERIVSSSDTTSVIISQMITPRRGSYGCGNQANSWIIAGFDTNTVERLNHSNLTQTAVPCADVSGPFAGGASLYGNTNAFLCGSAYGAEVLIFSTVTETATATNSMPERVRDCAGSCDSDIGWCPGGVKSNGEISETTQKIVLDISTWSHISSLEIVGGRARHSAFYRNHNLYLSGGISGNGGLTSNVSLLDTTTDVAVSLSRCYLSTGRDFIGGINNLEWGWNVGGNNMGSVDIVDRIDFSNDTTDAIPRATLNYKRYYATCVGQLEFSAGIIEDSVLGCFCHNAERISDSIGGTVKLALGSGPYSICEKFFMGGGQNYDTIYDTVDKLDVSVDTLTLEVNSTLTNRYSLIGFSSLDNSWYSAGLLDMDGTETNVTERLDHSNLVANVVSRSASPTAFGNGASAFFDNKGFAKNAEKSYLFDFSTETWTVLSDYGMEIFQAGCGIGPYAIFAGGTVGSERSNDVYKYDPSANVWSIAPNILSMKRSGSAASANSENVWYAGGSKYGSTSQIERFDVFTTTSVAMVRSALSSAKQRLGSAINQDYIWYSGGYRTGALGDIDRYDYFNDTVSALYRGQMSAPRHSFGSTGAIDYGTRTFCDRTVKVYLTQTTDKISCFYGSKAADDVSGYFYPVERVFDQRYIRFKVVPWQELSQRTCILTAAVPEQSTLLNCLSYGTYTSVDSITNAEIPQITINGIGFSNDHTLRPYKPASEARMWIAGGTNMNVIESIDQSSGWTPRGELSVGRTNAAGVSAINEAWFGGGAVDNLIEHFNYTNDTDTVIDVADLSINRSQLMATHSHQYGWFWSGEKTDGNLTGVIDRLDKDNYTVQAMSRAYETNRKGAKGDSCCSLMYGIGGKNFISNLDYVVSLSPDNDTLVRSAISFPKPTSSHTATSWDDNSIYIQHYSDIWKFDVCSGLFTVLSGIAYYRTNGTSYRSDSTIIIAGGSHNSYTKYTEKFDPSNGVCDTRGETTFLHNSPWSVGERAYVVQITPNTICNYSSKDRQISDISSLVSSVSAGNNLPTCFYAASEISSSLDALAYGIGGCTVTEGFGRTWMRSGFTCYMLDSPDGSFTLAQELPVSSERSTSFTNADYGWFIGGTNRIGCRISYWDGSTVVVEGANDQNQQFAGGLSQANRGILFGGVSSSAESNVMIGTEAIRALDFSTGIWTFVNPFLPERWARGGAAQVGNLGYLVGGNRGSDWSISDYVTKIDLTTDTNTEIASILPFASDLLSSVSKDDGNIILSIGARYYPTNDLCEIVPQLEFIIRYGSSFGCGSHEGVLIGGKDQRYSDSFNLGDIYSGGNSITQMEYVDYSTDTITICPNMSPPGLTENVSVSPYSYCRPEGRGIGLIDCVLSSYGNYNSTIDTVLYREYTYTDSLCAYDCIDYAESTLLCSSMSVEEGVRDCITSSATTILNGRTGFVHNAVEPHNSDVQTLINAVDTISHDLSTFVRWEQASGTRGCFSESLVAQRLWSTRGGFLYSGGPYSTIKCMVPLSFDLEWSYSVNAPDTEILSKQIDRGSLEKILEKTIFEDLTSIDIDQILKDLQAKYKDQRNVVYLVESQESTKLNEDILFYRTENLDRVTLVMNTSDPYFLFRISNEQNFKVTSDKEYFVNGSKIIPMIYGTQILRITFDEPLPAGERITLELRSRANSISIRLTSL